jgi:hypothetical protein
MLLLRGGALYSKPVQSAFALQAASHADNDSAVKGRLVPVPSADVRQHPAGRICVNVDVTRPLPTVKGCVEATVVVACDDPGAVDTVEGPGVVDEAAVSGSRHTLWCLLV